MKWIRRIFERPAVFTVTIEPGGAHRVEGSISPRKTQLITDLLDEANVSSGTIFGVRKGGRVLLECSSAIPANVAQRLRNVWVSER